MMVTMGLSTYFINNPIAFNLLDVTPNPSI
jgi:hypothetical protein